MDYGVDGECHTWTVLEKCSNGKIQTPVHSYTLGERIHYNKSCVQYAPMPF